MFKDSHCSHQRLCMEVTFHCSSHHLHAIPSDLNVHQLPVQHKTLGGSFLTSSYTELNVVLLCVGDQLGAAFVISLPKSWMRTWPSRYVLSNRSQVDWAGSNKSRVCAYLRPPWPWEALHEADVSVQTCWNFDGFLVIRFCFSIFQLSFLKLSFSDALVWTLVYI